MKAGMGGSASGYAMYNKSMTPSMSIVIPSWNSETQLKQNLPAVIKAAARVDADIIVVDDHSTKDESATYLASLPNIRLLINPENLGFGATVNRGVQASDRDLVVLLNTDVRPAVDCFVKAAAYFTDPMVFAVGFNSGEGSMRLTWEKGLMHHFRDDDWSRHTPPLAAWASGGQAAFDREKWLQLGGMDELYAPFYWEDTDLGYNAWKAGWKIIWGEDARCVHDHKKSVITSHFHAQRIARIAQRNQFLFHWKNLTDPQLVRDHLWHALGYAVRYPLTVMSALWRLPRALRSRRRHAPLWQKSDQDILNLWRS